MRAHQHRLEGASRRQRIVAMAVTGALAVSLAAAAAAPAGAKGSAQGGDKAGGGGTLNYAITGETTGGFCLPQAQLASPGIQESLAIYDPLTAITSQGKYVPYLAKSITPNATFDEWTIGLRPGVKFHDGTPVDADAIKLNLDSFRGANPRLPARLGIFTYQNVDSVTVQDPLTVVVKTKTPWPAFPAYLSSGRAGISAPAQLNDPETCAKNMIGSGPFKLKDWRVNESMTVERNPDYWQKGYPKADEIVFTPVQESNGRLTGLKGGQYDLIQEANSLAISDLKDQAKSGDIKLFISDKGSETAYQLLNVSKPPFDDILARKAVAYAGDVDQINHIRNKDLNTIASSPFPPDNPAHLPGRLNLHNVQKAKAFAKAYEKKHGEPLAYEYLSLATPETIAFAELVKEQDKKAGIEVSIRTLDLSALINEALAGRFTSVGWLNHPGGDPDTQYAWWHSGSPVNFGRISDPVIDKDLDQGRVETDPAKRTALYRDLGRRFQKELYNLWAWYTLWAIAYQNNVSGVKGPPLPDNGGQPFALYGGDIPLLTLAKK
jgi:peptide/nickel transport system substrate-binding protein